MTHDSMIEVIAAHRDGKEVQFRRFSETGREWRDLKTGFAARDNFDFISYDYRIKPTPPKPREWWIVRDGHNVFVGMYQTEVEAKHWYGPGFQLIHVIEVLPSTGEEGTRITISDNQVLAWLGRWRDEIPHNAVSSLQDILGVPESKPPVPGPANYPGSGIIATGGYP